MSRIVSRSAAIAALFAAQLAFANAAEVKVFSTIGVQAALEELTRWPWLTTALAGLVILNPLGLAFLQGTLNRTGGDLLWEFTATVTGAALAALLVMAWIE